MTVRELLIVRQLSCFHVGCSELYLATLWLCGVRVVISFNVGGLPGRIVVSLWPKKAIVSFTSPVFFYWVGDLCSTDGRLSILRREKHV